MYANFPLCFISKNEVKGSPFLKMNVRQKFLEKSGHLRAWWRFAFCRILTKSPSNCETHTASPPWMNKVGASSIFFACFTRNPSDKCCSVITRGDSLTKSENVPELLIPFVNDRQAARLISQKIFL